jgi:hypothetical protein
MDQQPNNELNKNLSENDGKEKNENKSRYESGVQSALDLVELVITYVKEQLAKMTYESFFAPLNSFKISLVSGIVSAFLFGSAAIFLAIALVLLLMQFFAPWLSFAIIALILMVAGLLLSRRNGES